MAVQQQVKTKKRKHECPPHHFLIDSDNVGHCRYCGAEKDFGRLLLREGVFAVAGQRGAKARKEVVGKTGKGQATIAEISASAGKSAAARERWQNPEYRANQIAARKKHWQDPEQRAKQSAVMKKRWQDPEQRAKQSAVAKKLWQDPEYQAKQSAALSRTTP